MTFNNINISMTPKCIALTLTLLSSSKFIHQTVAWYLHLAVWQAQNRTLLSFPSKSCSSPPAQLRRVAPNLLWCLTPTSGPVCVLNSLLWTLFTQILLICFSLLTVMRIGHYSVCVIISRAKNGIWYNVGAKYLLTKWMVLWLKFSTFLYKQRFQSLKSQSFKKLQHTANIMKVLLIHLFLFSFCKKDNIHMDCVNYFFS